jgi:acetate kinase
MRQHIENSSFDEIKNETILVINAGSSSIKFSLIFHGEIENVFSVPVLSIFDAKHKLIFKSSEIKSGYEPSIQAFFKKNI